jgi:hypothetical protein
MQSTCGGRRRTITRKAYTRKAHTRRSFTRPTDTRVRNTTVKTTRVPSSKITDRGAPGRWADKHGEGIGKLKPGGLSRFGYTVRKRSNVRHRSLRRSVHSTGALKTFRKLNAVAIYTKRTDKDASRKYTADRNWVKKTFMKH